MIKKMQLIILLAVVMLGCTLHPPYSWADNSSEWKKSYTLEAEKKYADAISALDSIPETAGDAQLLLLRKGWLNYLLGQYNESVNLYKQAIQQSPESLDAPLGITLPLLAQQHWQEAITYAKQVLKIAPYQYTAFLRLLQAEEGAHDWISMKKHAEDLAEHYPTDATALVYLARSNAWLGDNEAARKAYGSVLSLVPGHEEATAYLNKK
jgi:tetratricopeptide (TPR) repeat protein